jgi:hypothetical protein
LLGKKSRNFQIMMLLAMRRQAMAATGCYCYKAAVGRILVVSSFRTLQQQGNDHGLGKGVLW